MTATRGMEGRVKVKRQSVKYDCYYLTSVAKDRLPVFGSDKIKTIACAALDEARRSGKFALYSTTRVSRWIKESTSNRGNVVNPSADRY